MRTTNMIEKEMHSILDELKMMPNGYLVNRGKYFFQRINKKETAVTFDKFKIQQLARKKFILAKLTELRIELANLKEFEIKPRSLSNKEIISDFAPTYQKLDLSSFYHPSVKPFLEKEYPKNDLYLENLIYQTKQGIPVRSKSELMIANILEEYQIPYRYEIPFKVGNKTQYPDFVIKNPFTGANFIWEHFGALNKEEYENRMNQKMRHYLTNGYAPFQNLIYTFEFDLFNNCQRIHDLINQIILI